MPRTWSAESPSPAQAVARLAEGNHRFREQGGTALARSWNERMAAETQHPFAVVLGCSDSRAPVEILFDQGFGDLFVIRVAGNIVAPSIVGSIEFAVSQFGTRLVVVMGHTRCGAVSATVDAIQTGAGPESKNLQAITDRIAPHIQQTVAHETGDRVMAEAVRANVRASAAQLRTGSRILEELVLAKRVAVVGAEYELETGRVDFFDGAPV